MAKLSRPQRNNANSDDIAPDPKILIVRWLARWVKKRGCILPAPCPKDFEECAEWWLRHMQEPERPQETLTNNNEFGKRCIEGYAYRCGSALLAFLDMTDADRMLIVGGVQDGVPYRGDSPVLYRDIYEETMNMRKVGADSYREQAIEKMHRLTGAMLK